MPCCCMIRCNSCIPASSSPTRVSPSRTLASISKSVLDKPARVAECQSNASRGTYWRGNANRRARVDSGTYPHRRCRCQYRTDISMKSYELPVPKKPESTQASTKTASSPHATLGAHGVGSRYNTHLHYPARWSTNQGSSPADCTRNRMTRCFSSCAFFAPIECSVSRLGARARVVVNVVGCWCMSRSRI